MSSIVLGDGDTKLGKAEPCPLRTKGREGTEKNGIDVSNKVTMVAPRREDLSVPEEVR